MCDLFQISTMFFSFQKMTNGGKSRLLTHLEGRNITEAFQPLPGHSQANSPAWSLEPKTSRFFVF